MMQSPGIQLTGLFLTATCVLATETLPELVDYTDITQLCDHLDFCTSNARKQVTSNRKSCCFSCFCSEFCWARDDCCPDVTIPAPTNILELEKAVECVSSSQTFVYGRREAIHINATHYWMITNCVGLAESHPYAEKCQLKDDSSLVDLVPVWSPSTLDVYRNKYCAMCYNVSEYELFSWDLGELQGYLEVNENVSWNVIDHILRHPASTGNVLLVYTTDITEVAYCNRTYINECPNDSNISQYDEFLRDMCEAHTHPFYHFKQLFKNIYCYLCNTDYHLFNETHGPALDSYVHGQCLVADIELATVSSAQYLILRTFTELLTFEEDITRDQRQTCSDTEILDPYMNKCRPLLCPELSVPYNGVCYYTDGYYTPRKASFHVEAHAAYYQSVNATGNLIENKLKQLSGDVFHSVCSVVIGVNGDSEDESIEHSVTRNYFISIGFLNDRFSTQPGFTKVRGIHEFISSDFTNLGIGLTGRLLKGIDSRNFSYKEQLITDYPECTGKFQTILMWCPSIELSEDEFRYTVAHKILPSYFEFNNPSTLAANGSAPRQICVKDYVHDWVYTSRASKIVHWPRLIPYMYYTVCMTCMYIG